MSVARYGFVAAGLVLTIGACGEAGSRVCRQSGQAEFCLVEDRAAYEAEGHGFRPGSEVHISLDGTSERADAASESPPTLRADQDGKVPGRTGGVVGLLRGPKPQRLIVTGIAAGGEQVRFEFTAEPRVAR